MEKTLIKTQKLFKSTSLVSLMTLISRLLGFVRDVVYAQIFGAGAQFDAFVIALKIPNFLRRLFAEGAFSQAFVPIFTEVKIKQPHESVLEFAGRVAGVLSMVVLLLIAIAEMASPLLIMIFAPGFTRDPMRFQSATHILRITFPYLWLITMVAFAGAILNTCKRFGVFAFAPVLLNAVMIAVAWWWAPHTRYPIYTLSWGIIFGGVLQLVLMIPFLIREKLLPRLKWGFTDPVVRRVMKLMVPALFGVSVAQLSLLVDNIFASFLPTGSISWLYYSDRLMNLPLGVIGIALATVVMPTLSRYHQQQNFKNYALILDWAIRLLLFIGVPSAVGLLVLAGPILVTLIQHGQFNTMDVLQTRKSLVAFSIGLPAFMLVKNLAAAFYSRQNIRTPVKIAAFAMGANVIFNFIFIWSLRHAGLALSTSLSSWFNAALLYYFLYRRGIYQLQPGWMNLGVKLLLANAVMALLLLGLAGPIAQWEQWNMASRIWHLMLIILAGIGSYLIILGLLGVRLRDFHSPSD